MPDATARALARVTPPRRERDVQTAVLIVLRAYGACAYPLNRERAGYRRASHIGFKGLPDIGGYVRTPTGPRPLYVEVKRAKGGRKRPEQEAFLAQARADGCCAFRVTSVDETNAALRAWHDEQRVRIAPREEG